MHSSAVIQLTRRWLPLLVLLVALAQLSTAAHQHEDEHRLADCMLCLQHAGLKDLHGGYNLPHHPAITGVLPAPLGVHTDVTLPLFTTQAIRAPPVPSLPFIA